METSAEDSVYSGPWAGHLLSPIEVAAILHILLTCELLAFVRSFLGDTSRASSCLTSLQACFLISSFTDGRAEIQRRNLPNTREFVHSWIHIPRPACSQFVTWSEIAPTITTWGVKMQLPRCCPLAMAPALRRASQPLAASYTSSRILLGGFSLVVILARPGMTLWKPGHIHRAHYSIAHLWSSGSFQNPPTLRFSSSLDLFSFPTRRISFRPRVHGTRSFACHY